MARREDIDNTIWDDDDFDNLSSDAALLYLWSFTNPRCGMAGIYKVKRRHLGEGRFDEATLDRALDELKAGRFLYYESGVLWVRTRIKHLRTKGDPMKRSIEKDLSAIPNGHVLLRRLAEEYRDSWMAEVLPEGSGEGSNGGTQGVPTKPTTKPNMGTPGEPPKGFQGQGQGQGQGKGVVEVLGEISEIRGIPMPDLSRVDRAVAEHPDSDPLKAAKDARDWACDGGGKGAAITDVVDLFRRQLGFASSRRSSGTKADQTSQRIAELRARGAAA